MYKFVDIKGIAKSKVISRLDKLSAQGIVITMDKQALDNTVDSILSDYLNGSNQSLNTLDIIVDKKLSVKILEYI